MDGKAFDELTRTAANGTSRRATFGMIAGAALAAGLAKFDLTDAKKKGKGKNKKKKKCRKLNQGCGGKKKKCCKGLTCTDGTCLAPTEPECVVDSDCGSGEICQNGVCVPEPPECTVGSDCDDDEICQNGECVPNPFLCESDDDCAPNAICDDGACFCPEVLEDRCVIRCDPDGDCPGACSCRGQFPGSGQPRVVCVDDFDGCFADSCDSSDDCAADEFCSFADCGADDLGRCFPICVA